MPARFFLDTEYTNGNYYRGDIFEIALISETTYRVFHQYIKIKYRLPNNVKTLCRISDEYLLRKGVPFTYMLKRMLLFIKSETDNPTIIAHSGYLNDFPLLFINCIKHNINVADVFKNYTFIDSLKVIRNSIECRKPGLKSIIILCYKQHTALSDVKSLLNVFTKQQPYTSLLSDSVQTYSTNDIVQFMNQKLPLSIDKHHQFVYNVHTVEQLKQKLAQYVKEKSALKRKQLVKVSFYAYKYLC